jgi:hypothetical protein
VSSVIERLEYVIDASELGLTGLAYTAGAVVPAGRYRRIDAPGRDVELAGPGALPPSFDGRVAVYLPVVSSFARGAS